MFSILRPYIFSLDPEVAHDLAIKSLKINILPKSFFEVEGEELLETNLFGKKIPNPFGLAAGFDKSAEVYNSLFRLGYGFVEVGTVTPKRQLGNPKPRIFRLEKDQALINRLGFNNHGSEIISKRIASNLPTVFLESILDQIRIQKIKRRITTCVCRGCLHMRVISQLIFLLQILTD